MKRFIAVVISIKLNACLLFTALTAWCAILELVLRIPLISAWYLIQLLVLSFLCGTLQYVFYSGEVVKRMSTLGRAVCFALSLLAVVTAFAVGFRWFPTGEWTAWALFLALFLAAFLGIGLGLEVMFRITGRRYTDLLYARQNRK